MLASRFEEIKDYDLKWKFKVLLERHKVESLSPFDQDLIDTMVDMITSLEEKMDEIYNVRSDIEVHADDARYNYKKASETLDKVPQLETQLRHTKNLQETLQRRIDILTEEIEKVIELKKTLKEAIDLNSKNNEFKEEMKSILSELLTYLEKPKRLNMRQEDPEPVCTVKLREKIEGLLPNEHES